MIDALSDLTLKERTELAGELAAAAYLFFHKREHQSVAGMRVAAKKYSVLAGRISAAVMHPGKLDSEYLMLARRYETVLGGASREVVETIMKARIRPV